MAKKNKQKSARAIKLTAEMPPRNPVDASRPDRFKTAAAWIVFTLAIALYANTLDLKYTLDDTLMITENTFTKKGIDGIGEIFTNDAFVGFLGKNNLLPGGRYRPLSQVMFALEYEVFGLNPFPGHLINVLLYAFTCLLLFRILLRLIPDNGRQWQTGIAFLTAVLFTAHPLHTEVVANIKGRDEILCLFLSLASLWMGIRHLQNPRWWKPWLSALLLFFGILSKENAFTFLAIIPLTLFFFTSASFRKIFLATAPLLLAVAAYVALRIAVIGARISDVTDNELLNNPFVDSSSSEKYATLLITWLKYLQLMIFPHPLTHDYYPKQIPITNWSNPLVWLSLAIFTLLLIYALVKLKKKTIPSYALLFFFLSFSIVSNLVFNIGTFMNERFLFTSLLGFSLLSAYGLQQLSLQKKFRTGGMNPALIALIVITALYSIKTVSRNRVWMDDLTLFTTDVKVSENSTKCNTSAGGKLIEYADSLKNDAAARPQLLKALGYLDKAVKIYPQNISAWLLTGNAHIKLKNYHNARIALENCLRINPHHAHALNNLLHTAQASLARNEFVNAREAYLSLLKYTPEDERCHFGLGLAYRGLNRYDSALISLNKAIEIKAGYSDAWAKIGEIYGQNLGNIGKAEEYLLKAVALNPSDASALENLGIVYGIRRQYELSLSYFSKALEINPAKTELYTNIAATYHSMGNKAKAEEYFRKAQENKKP